MNDSLSEYHILVDALAGELPSIPLIMNDLLKIVSDSNAALFGVRDIIKKDLVESNLFQIMNDLLKIVLKLGKVSDERIILISDAIQLIESSVLERIGT